MPKIIITENHEKWSLVFEGVSVVTPSEYFSKRELQEAKRFTIINLCRSHHIKVLATTYLCLLKHVDIK